jgi:hypothetical protein
VKTKQSDPRWGEYKTAAAYYASAEWLDVVRASLDSYRTCLESARRVKNAEGIAFYLAQVKACERELGIEAPAPPQTAQQSLFESLLKG